jgi:hypothetical protein
MEVRSRCGSSKRRRWLSFGDVGKAKADGHDGAESAATEGTWSFLAGGELAELR